MTGGFCPNCGAARTGQRFCATCGNDFWQTAAGTATGAPALPSSTTAPASKARRPMLGSFGKVLLALIAIGVVIGVVLLVTGNGYIFGNGNGGSVGVDAPPTATIWFGTSFDNHHPVSAAE